MQNQDPQDDTNRATSEEAPEQTQKPAEGHPDWEADDEDDTSEEDAE